MVSTRINRMQLPTLELWRLKRQLAKGLVVNEDVLVEIVRPGNWRPAYPTARLGKCWSLRSTLIIRGSD